MVIKKHLEMLFCCGLLAEITRQAAKHHSNHHVQHICARSDATFSTRIGKRTKTFVFVQLGVFQESLQQRQQPVFDILELPQYPQILLSLRQLGVRSTRCSGFLQLGLKRIAQASELSTDEAGRGSHISLSHITQPAAAPLQTSSTSQPTNLIDLVALLLLRPFVLRELRLGQQLQLDQHVALPLEIARAPTETRPQVLDAFPSRRTRQRVQKRVQRHAINVRRVVQQGEHVGRERRVESVQQWTRRAVGAVEGAF